MPPESTYVQSTLLPPDVVEVTLRLGVVNDGDHLQATVESRCPTDGTLVALWSLPHAPLAALPDVLSQARLELLKQVAAACWAV